MKAYYIFDFRVIFNVHCVHTTHIVHSRSHMDWMLFNKLIRYCDCTILNARLTLHIREMASQTHLFLLHCFLLCSVCMSTYVNTHTHTHKHIRVHTFSREKKRDKPDEHGKH